jgi:hypothetical protein
MLLSPKLILISRLDTHEWHIKVAFNPAVAICTLLKMPPTSINFREEAGGIKCFNWILISCLDTHPIFIFNTDYCFFVSWNPQKSTHLSEMNQKFWRTLKYHQYIHFFREVGLPFPTIQSHYGLHPMRDFVDQMAGFSLMLKWAYLVGRSKGFLTLLVDLVPFLN